MPGVPPTQLGAQNRARSGTSRSTSDSQRPCTSSPRPRRTPSPPPASTSFTLTSQDPRYPSVDPRPLRSRLRGGEGQCSPNTIGYLLGLAGIAIADGPQVRQAVVAHVGVKANRLRVTRSRDPKGNFYTLEGLILRCVKDTARGPTKTLPPSVEGWCQAIARPASWTDFAFLQVASDFYRVATRHDCLRLRQRRRLGRAPQLLHKPIRRLARQIRQTRAPACVDRAANSTSSTGAPIAQPVPCRPHNLTQIRNRAIGRAAVGDHSPPFLARCASSWDIADFCGGLCSGKGKR